MAHPTSAIPLSPRLLEVLQRIASATLASLLQVKLFDHSENGQDALVVPPIQAVSKDQQDVATTFENYDRVLLLGPPGSGKSTLLNWRALNSARAYLRSKEETRCPILVRGRDLPAQWSNSP